MKTIIEIKSIYGVILFSFEIEENTLRGTIVEAIKSGADLRDADLYDADLIGADLRGADLIGADLRDADLIGADLIGADLRGANLRGANLRGADLIVADLRGTNLRNADLRGTNLCDANLSGADLRGTNLRNADLRGADLRDVDYNGLTSFLPSQCPSEGSFIAWKKAGDMIVKLEVCRDAKRSSGTTLKCRCSAANVLEIQKIDGTKSDLTEVASDYDVNFIYRVGEIVSVDDFDDDRFNECSRGIHFFISREMAVKY